jgi:hypothetical protein
MSSVCNDCTNFERTNGGPRCKIGYLLRKPGEQCDGQNQPRALRYTHG